MKVCPSCGKENAEDARFCSGCATPLEPETPAREERKVVTCLFCDLVGFTARAERMDPEDVRRLLQPYHARVRSELERHGGTVEKFIGDAVMAVFGAPIAHEDDPERAVRAALAIRDTLTEDGGLEIRIGITTGEALIALGARPEVGEGMASGDVVNTAARLQAAAPTGGILVDRTTFRATERAVEYAQSEPVEAKGKAEPIPVWEARRARARVGVERVGGAPLVGREQELALLRETFARVIRERRPQLVTLVGVPGIGKSRLVFELFQTIETGVHGLVFWRHGRSLPYGDGVTFWALAEMVKAQAAILESDAPEAASEKLRHAVARYVTASDTAWVVRHLRPLVGLEAEEQLAGDRRGETFAAWRRLFEALAEERPLVLVFEDLHWADEALLDFVDYLVEWATGVPVLVLCTARPELLERRSSWGGGKVNSSTILLSPLSAEETAVLVHSLLGLSTLDADVRSRLLESAGGNPLYAEEFTRMLTARPADVVLPETVQGIIAARLDTLPSEEKELLQIAAVLGRVFWLGALGHDRWRVEERLHSLERKEFVSRSRRSSVAEEDEYTFRHALVREVAYEQIPKAERSDKHRAAGEWIESLGRPEDHAEMLAHHYAAALDYASGAGQDTDLLAERGRLALREAGDRAFALNAFPHAARFYERALDLWPAEEQGRAQLLFRYGRALWQAERKGIDILLEAVEMLVASADRGSAAEAVVLLAQVEWLRGHREEANAHLERAVDLVRDLPGSRSKAVVLASLARSHALAGAYDDAIRLGREALTLAEELLLDEVQAYALNYIGMARVRGGDLGGTADLERSVEIARAANSPEVARSCNNLGYELFSLGHLERSSELLAEAVRHAARFGEIALGRFTRAGPQLHLQLRQGKWDDVLEVANELIAETEAGSPDYQENSCRHARALIRLARGDVDGALADCERRLELAREIADPQALVPALGFVARIFVEVGRLEEAAALADELEVVKTRYRATLELPDIAVVLIALGRVEALRAAVDAAEGTRWAEAVQHYLTGEFQRAADVFADMGVRRDEADARLRAAEKLAGEGRRAEADEQLQKALAFYRSVGATRYIRQGEALLAAAS